MAGSRSRAAVRRARLRVFLFDLEAFRFTDPARRRSRRPRSERPDRRCRRAGRRLRRLCLPTRRSERRPPSRRLARRRRAARLRRASPLRRAARLRRASPLRRTVFLLSTARLRGPPRRARAARPRPRRLVATRGCRACLLSETTLADGRPAAAGAEPPSRKVPRPSASTVPGAREPGVLWIFSANLHKETGLETTMTPASTQPPHVSKKPPDSPGSIRFSASRRITEPRARPWHRLWA